MADVFVSDDVKVLLDGKTILFIGDANVRSLYKDLLWVSNHRKLIKSCCFTKNLKSSFSEDQLIMSEGEKSSWKYCEHRLYENCFRVELLYMNNLNLNFIRTFIERFAAGQNAVPDLVYFSCAWPRNESGGEDFFRLFAYLMYSLKRKMKKTGQIIFGSSFSMCIDGFGDPLMEEIVYLRSSHQSQQKMNWVLAELAEKMGFQILDPSFYFSLSPFRGAAQNSKSERTSLRFLTNLFLTFCANLWDKSYPRRVDKSILRRAQLRSSDSVREYLSLEKANLSLSESSKRCTCHEDDPAVKNVQCALKLIKTSMTQQNKAANRETERATEIEKMFEMPLSDWTANVRNCPTCAAGGRDQSENRFRKIDFTNIVDECHLLVLLNNNRDTSNISKRQSSEPVQDQLTNKRSCIRISPVETIELSGSSDNSSNCTNNTQHNSNNATASRVNEEKPAIATIKENSRIVLGADDENKDNIKGTTGNILQPTHLPSKTPEQQTTPRDIETTDNKLIIPGKDTSKVPNIQSEVVTVKDVQLFQARFKNTTNANVNKIMNIPLEESGKPSSSSLFNKATLQRVSRFLGQLRLKVKEPNPIAKTPNPLNPIAKTPNPITKTPNPITKTSTVEIKQTIAPNKPNLPDKRTYAANNCCEYKFPKREFVKNDNFSNLYYFPWGRRRRRTNKDITFSERFNYSNFSNRYNNSNLGRCNNSNYPGRCTNSNLPSRYNNSNIPERRREDSSRRYDYRIDITRRTTKPSTKVEEK